MASSSSSRNSSNTSSNSRSNESSGTCVVKLLLLSGQGCLLSQFTRAPSLCLNVEGCRTMVRLIVEVSECLIKMSLHSGLPFTWIFFFFVSGS